MSGLALVWHRNGRNAKPDDLAPMLAEMSRRGPDGEGAAFDGAVGLGHRLLASTPEAAVEAMPYIHDQTGCQITGHIRLDNRDELLTRFDLSNAGRVVGDGELTLLAWLTWGEECATHLLGDFAFAIWDPRKNCVFAARDQMGMRQLIYAHRPNQIFVCASSARAVVLTPDIEPILNDARIADSMVGFENSSLTSTFYQNVFRLPPAHQLILDNNGLRLKTYWQAKIPDQLKLKDDEAYAEAFREVLNEAVRSRLRGPNGQVGSMLSGGMDSGSVVALASRTMPSPLPTFSATGPEPVNCVETKAIYAALTLPNLASTIVDYSQLDSWKDSLITAWTEIEEPFDFHMTLPRAIFLSARTAGMKVLLDGGAGDVVLSHGSQMRRHVRSWQFARAWRDATGAIAFWGPETDSISTQMLQAIRGAYMPEAIRAIRRTGRRLSKPKLPQDSIIDRTYATTSGLIDRLQADRLLITAKNLTFQEEQISAWPRSGIVVGRERYDRVASYFGVEPRDPFMDQRLQAFCLSLPMDQFQANGWPKMILRRAMADLLPDSVRWRRGKEHLGARFTQELLTKWQDLTRVIKTAQNDCVGRVSRQYLEQNMQPTAHTFDQQQSEIELVSLSLFLNNKIS